MVEFITYQGKKYPMRISYYVLMMAQKESGQDMLEFERNLENQQRILWYGLVAGHQMAKKELTLKEEDMVWVLDECYLEYQKAAIEYGKALVEAREEALASKKK